MIYYFNFGWPFICPDDERKFYECRRWTNHNPKTFSYGSYAHYIYEDVYRIWQNPNKQIDLRLNK